MDIKKILDQYFTNDLDYCLTANEIFRKLPIAAKRFLGLDTKTAQAGQIISKLSPYFGNIYKEQKRNKTVCVGLDITCREMVIRQLKKTPDLSSKKLKQKLPMTNDVYFKTINSLLSEGAIICSGLYKDHVASSISIVYNNQTDEKPSINVPADPEMKLSQFRKAYETAGGGRPYVYIHKIRSTLGWPDRIFNQTLLDYAIAGTIVLQGGNPAHLTQSELAASYHDRNGDLHITVSWRKGV